MEISSFLSQEVEVTSLYFRSSPKGRRLEGYPRRMVYAGREYNFLEDSLRYLIKTGQKLIQLFDVSDGRALYRLRLDEENHWTLVGIKTA